MTDLIDRAALVPFAVWSHEHDDYVIKTRDIDAAPTIRCGECAACDTCDIHDHAILDVPNFGCVYFERRQP